MTETPDSIRKLRRRWRRRVAMFVLLLPAVLVGGLWLSQRLWLPSLIRPGLERATGLQFDASSLRVGVDGRIHANRPILRRADGGASLRATTIDVRVNWRQALRGKFDVRDVNLRRPIVRIDSAMAASLLSPTEANTAAPELDWFAGLPEVAVTDAVVQFTDSKSDEHRVVLSMRGDGSLTRRPDDPAVFDLTFEQTGGPDRVDFTGWLNTRERRATIRTENVMFTNWIAAFSIPNDAEFWRSILTEGKLVAAEIDIDAERGVASYLDLEGVRLALPTPATSAMAGERLVLENVSGRVFLHGPSLKANLAGLIDGLPTAATLETQGLSFTSPFRCDLIGGPFMVSQQWKPLGLAPHFVRRVLDDFSGPSAEVAASVVLSRDEKAAAPGEGISVAGEARVEHGAATFLEFPYPMRDVAGTVRFDDDLIQLLDLTGVGLTGAKLRGEGTVTPVPGSVVLDLMIWGEQAPIDSVLLSALDDHEREIVESLFSQSAAGKLTQAGAFASTTDKAATATSITNLTDALKTALDAGESARADAIRASIADLRKVDSRPTFDVGGLVDVQARVQWDGRRTPRHQVDVDVHFDRAGLLYEHFPYPVVLEPLEAKIDLNGVTLTRAPIAGLTGAIGSIDGTVSYDRDGVQPDLSINFSHLPVDEPLLQAVAMATESTDRPLTMGGARAATTRMSVSDALLRFGAGGAVRGGATVGSDDSGVTWSVDVPLEGLTLRSSGGSGFVEAEANSFTGALNVSPDGWRITDATARLATTDVAFSIDAPREGDPTIRFACDAFNLQSPFEGFLHELDARAAAKVAQARSELGAGGTVAVSGSAIVTPRGPTYEVEIRGAGELTFGLGGRLLRLKPREGAVVVQNDAVSFDGVQLELLDPLGGSSGALTIDGMINDVGGRSRLKVTAAGFAIESPLSRRVLARLRPQLADWMETARPTGRFNASAILAAEADQPLNVVSGVIEPKSFHFTAGAERIEIDTISGSLTLGPNGGEIRQLQVRAAHWSAHLDGNWFAGATPGIDVRVSARGDALQDDIVALLPHDVRDVFRVLDIRVDGGFELHDGSLAINAPIRGQDLGDGFRDGVYFSGSVSCHGAAIDAGVAFSEIRGDVDITASRLPFAPATEIDVDLRLAHAKAAGLTLQNVEASIRSASDEWDVLEIDVLGESHEGRIWGQGEIRTRSGSDRAAGYLFDLRLAGLDLATAIHEYTGAATSLAPDVGHRGHVDASLVLAGDLSAGSQPRGAGELRILGGELARLPLVITVLELGNLIPPIGEKLDYARADFALANGVATFDRLLVVSPSMALVGEGDITLPGFELDLRFGASGNYRLPIFSSLFDVVRNEFLTTRVRGTLGRPEFSLEQLSATRRLFSRVFGGGTADGAEESSVAEVSESPN